MIASYAFPEYISTRTLSLLNQHRATPFKCGSLYQVERGSAPMQREFLLFSDCLLYGLPTSNHQLIHGTEIRVGAGVEVVVSTVVFKIHLLLPNPK